MENCESSPVSCASADADLFGLLPDELVTDILSRIPIQQLWHCSTVCKRWHSLLRTPSFAQEHEKRPASSSVPLVHRGFELAATQKREPPDESRLVFLKDSKYTLFRAVHLNGDAKKKISWPMSQLRASYHGLLLFEQYPYSTHCILNPLTGEVVTFDIPRHVCGLYYHPPSRQYRLLRFRSLLSSDGFHYCVCSTSQTVIKEVGTFDFRISNFLVRGTVLYSDDNAPAVAAGSFLYWLAYKRRESDRYIMTFDVMNETLQFMPHPLGHPIGMVPLEERSTVLELWSTQLFEVGNQLHLFVAGWQRIGVWALHDHMTWRWNKVFALDLAPDRELHEGTWNWLPLGFEDGELLYLLPGWGLFRTNTRTKWVDLISYTGRWKDRSVCMVNRRRSLVSFKDYS